MSIAFKCKMCGGALEIIEGNTTCECEYCGTTQTVPNLDNEKKTNLFNRANRLRMNNEFDKAAGIYESIVSEFTEEAEAYWGLCLCKYGIEYVDDPATGKKIPTCHRTSFDSIFDDNNFELATEYADVMAKRLYRDEAKEIDRLQKAILEIAQKEEPYDIFICYKETAEDGQRTKDSVMAQDIYDALTAKGYKVFFARITLEDKLGQEYEPFIFSALNSAKVMLAIGTDYEYFNAVWVKNEWSRFLDMMKKDKSKVLIPCYADIDAYDMPQEFKHLQGQDMGKIGFIQDLVRGVGKIIGKEEPKAAVKETVVVQQISNANIEPLLKRAFMFLEDGEWDKADDFCEQVLNLDPECAEAYLGKLMAELKVRRQDNLKNCDMPFDNKNNYSKAYKFADKTLKSKLSGYNKYIRERNETAPKEDIYSKACESLKNAIQVSEYYRLAKEFDIIKDYKDSAEKIKECEKMMFLHISKKTSETELESVFINNYFWYKEIESKLSQYIASDENKGFTNPIISFPEIEQRMKASDSLVTELINNEIEMPVRIDDEIVMFPIYGEEDGEEDIEEEEYVIVYSDESGGLVIEDFNYNKPSNEDNVVIELPEGISGIGYYSFDDIGYSKLIFPASLTSFANPEANCEYEFKNSSFRCIEDGIWYSQDKLILFYCPTGKESFVIPEGVKRIEAGAFSDCKSLTSIKIPESVTSIGESVFSGCESLKSITIPESVTSIGGSAFSDCKLLKSITIPESVTSIDGYAFSGCKSLTSITIPGSVTSIGEGAFSDCKSLTSIMIPESVTSIGESVFSGCESLTSITIPGSVTSIGGSAFSDCESLTSITILGSVTSIGGSAFSGCESLTSITIPESVTSIGWGAFSDCKSIASITIPESVTSIGEGAFYNCESLTSITIPESVTSIGENAFYNCESLTSITIPDSLANANNRGKWGVSLFTIMTHSEYIEKQRRKEMRQRQEEMRHKQEEEARQRQAQMAKYRTEGVCQHCGGTFKGLFSKTCSSCGKKKDY